MGPSALVDVFNIADKGCVLGSPLALAYAISVATVGGANRIILSGVDGYDSSDPRQIEMVKILEQYKEQESACNILAITPTSYPVVQCSVFQSDI